MLVVPLFVTCFALASPAQRPQSALPAQPAQPIQPIQPIQQDGAQHPPAPGNRLATEKSPYLLAHARNPVDWYPWGEEAFAKAKREDKPVFLSIGYSACHWCHVMERESFEDAEIATFLNTHYVAVKVDREERPDVDAVYMEYVTARTGSGGWPLTVVLTPEKRPIFGGTYYPPRNGPRAAGLLELLQVIEEQWRTNRAEVDEAGAAAAEWLATARVPGAREDWPSDLSGRAIAQHLDRLEISRDREKSGPLFPRPMLLELLLRHEAESGDSRALAAVTSQLDAMASGGVHDVIGGGFFRYSVDGEWLVPHFEKMLYVNAMLARIYTLAYQRTRDARYERVARDVLDHMLRDMALEGGGFACSLDADSAGADGASREGNYYTFTPDEVRAAVSGDLGDTAVAAFGITEQGNLDGRSVPNRRAPAYVAMDDATRANVEAGRALLLAARAKRSAPARDEKVLCDWNGLAISALALAGRVFDAPEYRGAARQAADFLMTKLWDDGSQSLARRYCDGDVAAAGQLSDYAYLAQGLLDLYSAEFEGRDLVHAIALTDAMLVRFYEPTPDGGHGVFYDAPKDGEVLPMRPREASDGSTPSPTAVALRCLVRVSRLTGRNELETIARGCLEGCTAEVRASPLAYCELLSAADELAAPSREIVIAGTRHEASFEALVAACHRAPRFRGVLAFAPADAAQREVVAAIAELIEGRVTVDGKSAAYLCENRACRSPITDPEALATAIAEGSRPKKATPGGAERGN